MNNIRLIDANALKEAIQDIELSLTNKRQILDLINNAPTVETTCMVDKSNFSNGQYKTDIDTAYACGYEKGKNDRQKGIWIRKEVGISLYKYICSECGFVSSVGKPNFCQECGSDMRGNKK